MNIRILCMAVLLFTVCLFFSSATNAQWLDKADSAVSGLLDQVMNKTETARDYIDDTADERQEIYKDLNSRAAEVFDKSGQYIDENKGDWQKQYNSTKSKVESGIDKAQKYVDEHKGEWRVVYERVLSKVKNFLDNLVK